MKTHTHCWHKTHEHTKPYGKQRCFANNEILTQMTKREFFFYSCFYKEMLLHTDKPICSHREAFTRTGTPFTQLFCTKKINFLSHEMCFVADTFARNRVCTQTLFCMTRLHVVVKRRGNTSLKWHFFEPFGSNPCLHKKRNPVLATKILIQ